MNNNLYENKRFEYGVDLGWASQIESLGYSWTDHEGNVQDIVKLVKNGGKPIALGFGCWAAITTVSLLMQTVMGIM